MRTMFRRLEVTVDRDLNGRRDFEVLLRCAAGGETLFDVLAQASSNFSG